MTVTVQAARDGLRLHDRLGIRDSLRVRVGHADASAALPRDRRRRSALRAARAASPLRSPLSPSRRGSRSGARITSTSTTASKFVTFQAGAGLLMALSSAGSARRAAPAARDALTEAEALRDELGRRADLLDAANRCARALSSSLDLDEAFGAFIRELRGLVPFERMAIVLAEDGVGRVIATAGSRADDVMPPGSQAEPRAATCSPRSSHAGRRSTAPT